MNTAPYNQKQQALAKHDMVRCQGIPPGDGRAFLNGKVGEVRGFLRGKRGCDVKFLLPKPHRVRIPHKHLVELSDDEILANLQKQKRILPPPVASSDNTV